MVWTAIGIIMNAVISIFAFWMSMRISTTPPITIGGMIIGMLVVGGMYNFIMSLIGVQLPDQQKATGVGNAIAGSVNKAMAKKDSKMTNSMFGNKK